MRLLYIGKARGDAAVTGVGRRAPKSRAMHAAMVIAVGFALIILAGALLLMLPCAAKSGRATPFIDALFTATSATCVTGLVTVSTAVHWSLFGKCVILLLIQIGGLGFMSVMTAASLLLRRTITLRERMVIGAGFGLDSSGGIVRLMRRVLVGTFLFEGVGAGLLSIRFVQQFGPLRGVGMGVFHAVSAFCNGGFDLMGTPDDPFCSLVHYAEDPLVSLTIMALIVLGGLGFFVWSDVWDHRRFRSLSLHSKLVLAMSGVLLGGGFLLTLLFEWSNPATLGGMTLPHKLLAAAFQSVTLRTAGFNTIDEECADRPLAGGRVRAHADRRLARLDGGRSQDRDGGGARTQRGQRAARTDVGHGLRTNHRAAQHHECGRAHGHRRDDQSRRCVRHCVYRKCADEPVPV